MALQQYIAPGQSNALAIIQQPELTPEEREKRQKDAEELETKLKFINEKVPTRVQYVAGSTAGAGSGTFHEYRQARRREQDRLRRIEETYKEEKLQSDYKGKQDELRAQDDERTAKRRAKRERKKAKKKAKGGDGGTSAAGAAENAGSDSGDELPGDQPALD